MPAALQIRGHMDPRKFTPMGSPVYLEKEKGGEREINIESGREKRERVCNHVACLEMQLHDITVLKKILLASDKIAGGK